MLLLSPPVPANSHLTAGNAGCGQTAVTKPQFPIAAEQNHPRCLLKLRFPDPSPYSLSSIPGLGPGSLSFPFSQTEG